MTTSSRFFAAGLAGLVLGNLPSADLAGRLTGHDLGSEGTGNPGAMNASHVLGKKWGTVVVAADIGKGLLAARVGNRLAGPTGANLASTLAVAGHCHPVGRRGGKGVATSVGQVAGTFPVYLPVDIGVGVATAALPFFRQRTRTATSVASVTWVGFAALWWRRGLRNPGGVTPTAALPIAAIASSVVIARRFATEVGRVESYNREAHDLVTVSRVAAT
jgi:acyl phosphate:glycerol-3-phosphate acyltransferase